jgi:Ca2+-binding EF-hand superfamily protein
MSKYNISARIEINSKWFDKVDTNKDLKIDCNELCTYLKKIKFNESKNFLTDLE